MTKGDSKGVIVISVKSTPEMRIRERTNKFSRIYVRLAFLGLAFSLLIILIMAIWKEDLQSHTAGETQLTGLKTLFSLDSKYQWIILWSLNGWAIFEVFLTLALKGLINNESATLLRVWLCVYLLDCVLAAVLLLVIIFFFVTLASKIVLGIVIVLIVVYEIYFVNTLFQFLEIITHSNPHAYEQPASA